MKWCTEVIIYSTYYKNKPDKCEQLKIPKYVSLLLQTYLKLIKKQQKELNTLKKKHSKVGDGSSVDLRDRIRAR